MTIQKVLSLGMILFLLSAVLLGCGSAPDSSADEADEVWPASFTDSKTNEAQLASFPDLMTDDTPETQTHATTTQPTANIVRMPDLPGTDRESARSILVNCGLVPVFFEEYSNFVTAGLVTRTEPSAFAEVPAGTSVTVYISRGVSRYDAANMQVYTTSLNQMFHSDDVYVQVKNLYVENGVLHLVYQIGFKEYRNDYDYSQLLPEGSINYYFKYTGFSVKIGDSLFTPTAIGEAIDSYVPRNRLFTPIKYDEIHLQIPLNDSVSRTPTQIDVTYTAQVHMDDHVNRYSTDNNYRNTFSLRNITW